MHCLPSQKRMVAALQRQLDAGSCRTREGASHSAFPRQILKKNANEGADSGNFRSSAVLLIGQICIVHRALSGIRTQSSLVAKQSMPLVAETYEAEQCKRMRWLGHGCLGNFTKAVVTVVNTKHNSSRPDDAAAGGIS